MLSVTDCIMCEAEHDEPCTYDMYLGDGNTNGLHGIYSHVNLGNWKCCSASTRTDADMMLNKSFLDDSATVSNGSTGRQYGTAGYEVEDDATGHGSEKDLSAVRQGRVAVTHACSTAAPEPPLHFQGADKEAGRVYGQMTSRRLSPSMAKQGKDDDDDDEEAKCGNGSGGGTMVTEDY